MTLFVYATGISGNLDPFVAVADSSLDRTELSQTFRQQVQQAIDAGQDPLSVVPQVAGTYFLTWDDDSGDGYASALSLDIPSDGSYQLLVISSIGSNTYGGYQLTVGINAPLVTSGTAQPTGEVLAVLDNQAADRIVGITETTDTLTERRPETFRPLANLSPGDTVYIYVETTAGDLAPIVTLRDFGGKVLATGNYSGQQQSASLQYTVDSDAINYRVNVRACCAGSPTTTGDFRMLVGVNAPEVLDGNAAPGGQLVLKQPVPVRIGIKMDQITGVDQKSENYGVVADVRMEWDDPRLAFSPDTCQCRFQTFQISGFLKYLDDKGITDWPAATLYNQQGRRDGQGETVVVFPEGRAVYVSRFSATLQAPDFDFRRFPFDKQVFFIRFRSVFPEELYVYEPLPGFSGLGEQLGEEEWIVTGTSEEVDSIDGSSRFSFRFEAVRHLYFYIFRIFVPVLVIIIVSWITFFLKDYGKRVDVASGNLLLFIAFNFTISSDLPRLGYLTLMDSILVSTFVVTSLVVIFSVYLKWLEVGNRKSIANKIDWIYPFMYVAAFTVVFVLFA